MDDTTRRRLFLVAHAQRNLSIGLGVLVAVVVGGSVLIGFGGQNATFAVQAVSVLVSLYIAAAVFQLSRAMGHVRGLRITLTLAVLFVPFAALVVPLVMLWRARRMLRNEAIEAGIFMVRRSEMDWLAREPGPAMVCGGCGYDLEGIGDRELCPECGRLRE